MCLPPSRRNSHAAVTDPVSPAPAPDEGRVQLVHRELVLLVVLVCVAAAGFLLTRAVVAGNDRMRRQDAAAWYDAARRDLGEERSADATTALRRAAAKDPTNKRYQVALAAALASSHQDEAARQVLVGLREIAPEDAEVNTELARLDARRGDLTNARRYYQSALNALWSPEQSERRQALRLELIRLLLDHQEKSRALAELLILSAALPDVAAPQVQAGRLLLEAGDPRSALDRFSAALKLEPASAMALTGAGASAFALADYPRAMRYLSLVPARTADIVAMRELAELVLAHDPLAPRLSSDERFRRLVGDVTHARQRLIDCLPLAPSVMPAHQALDALQRESMAFEPSLTVRAVRESPDAIETGLELVDRIEQATERGCMPLAALDRALMLVGRLHRMPER